MTPNPDDALPPNTVRCPTCRAVQEWSDTCRRCKSDLRLLREFAAGYERSRRACLEELRAGHPRAARRAAQHCQALRAGAESRRLLALASLYCGDWPTAAALARRVLRDGRSEAEQSVGFGHLRTRVGGAGGLGVQSSEGPEGESSMATTTEPKAPATSTDTDRRFVLHNVGWQGYETMLQLVGDRPIRLTYDRGNLELNSPSRKHEESKRLHDVLIQAIVEELEIPCIGAASTTWRREDLDRGLEPDECYYLFDHAEQNQDKEIDLRIDPPPDLAIEIDITRSSLDRLASGRRKMCLSLSFPGFSTETPLEEGGSARKNSHGTADCQLPSEEFFEVLSHANRLRSPTPTRLHSRPRRPAQHRLPRRDHPHPHSLAAHLRPARLA